ncbi:MAG: hypothetical protein LBK25_03305 [Treponema sp.]|jgi:hypothetical protein|nr:hypothetical protein [Treponema sp.]
MSSVRVSNNTEVPLASKRNRQDGVSGDPFLTTPVVKYLNTPCVWILHGFYINLKYIIQYMVIIKTTSKTSHDG